MKILLHWFAATTRALFVLTALVHILASQVAASSTEGFPRPAISGNITPAVPAAASMTDSADLRVSSSDSADPVIAGIDSFTYTHTVKNTSPSTATGVTLINTLPMGVTFVSASDGCSEASGSVTCAIGTLADDTTATITITVAVPASTRGVLENNVAVSSEQFDPNPSNNSFMEPTTVNGQVDLSISKSDDPDPVLLGNLLQYTIVVSNTGPSDAVDVVVTDALPPGVIFVGASTGCLEDSPGIVTCNIGSVASGPGSMLLISVQPTIDGVFSNTVSVTSGPYDSDTVPSNNTATEQTTVVGYANLSISKTTSSSTVNATDLLTYTLSVANSGPNSAQTITVTDTLPNGTGFISADGNGWTCSYDGVLHEVYCTLPSLLITTAPNITITIAAPSEGGTIVNTATVAAKSLDSNKTNNSASASTTVVPIVDVGLSAESLVSGMTIAYTFTITNAGPSTAASVALTATLPVGIEFSASSPGEPTCSASTGELICTLNALAPGGSTQVIVSGRVTSSAGGTVTTSAVAMGAASDSDLSNNAVTDLTFITMYRSFLPLILIHEPKPDLIGSLSLNPNKLNFSVDEPVEITVIVTNTGSVTAGPFWVDFYINPSTPPTKANMLWSELCTLDPCQGIAWYVTEGLAPGQSVQLTSRSYSENHSHWSGFFVPGTTDLYIYVDSWNPDSEHGLVQEVNEQNNRAELHGLTVSGVMAAQPALPRAADRPPRPLHDNARKQ